MNEKTQRKWDSAAKLYDLTGGFGPEKRWQPHKQRLFSGMYGKVLFLAAGTGLDFASFPPGQDITAIDISAGMLEKAKPRAATYQGELQLRQMDVHKMDFQTASFDQIYTSCTFCSVPDPVAGLQALRRVLKPGGRLGMFEHTGSRTFPFGLMLNVMNPLCRHLGPEINRDTEANVEAAGFAIEKITNVYLDVVKTIEARAPSDEQT
ncbi:MAG: class I SAM-dependent methyltransferase [Alphaproteobacteria bacterium]|jgi:ubiquinone/menaquinone biosynthesis C-methylase UbiE|nr:SAM-dependent methyltransferase [Rhodospirillaceae bacterium]MDP6406100.1 class I SAM-dependent methyltransferase [Alphaproteobacteria bacterium]MDP6620888.1 class I SAM-dependent methyltransferase [Alphaproteobacteria bacterium]|tara:strand:+ start:3339 stop:3959 length:621 start_codon:yes stop_codon:yes gene_type:complete